MLLVALLSTNLLATIFAHCLGSLLLVAPKDQSLRCLCWYWVSCVQTQAQHNPSWQRHRTPWVGQDLKDQVLPTSLP